MGALEKNSINSIVFNALLLCFIPIINTISKKTIS